MSSQENILSRSIPLDLVQCTVGPVAVSNTVALPMHFRLGFSIAPSSPLRLPRTPTVQNFGPQIREELSMARLKPQLPQGAAFAKDAAIEHLYDRLSRFPRITVLTGAGISTESGLSDYRSPGKKKPPRPPIQHQEFVASAAVRKRYWARSFVGFPVLSNARPNLAHLSLAALHDSAGSRFRWHITQNVDGLLQAARIPSASLVELHGTIHKVVCRSCGAYELRKHFQTRLVNCNKEWSKELGTYRYRPDGDADLDDNLVHKFQVPLCDSCGEEALMPALVFHGGQVPAEVADMATHKVEQSDALLVVGSTVTPFSAYRLVRLAKKKGAFLACVNFGATRADELYDVKVEALVGNAMARFANLQLAGGFKAPEGYEDVTRPHADELVRRLEL
ncbi:Sirtuin [Gracilaria domingensis]|nr:Sirtuin [Gracilaria domingensis]